MHMPDDWSIITALGDHYILQEFAEGTDYAPNVYIGPGGQAVTVVLEKTELKREKLVMLKVCAG